MNFFTDIFQRSPLSGCFHLFLQRGSARKYIFPREILLPRAFKSAKYHTQEYLFTGGSTYLLVNKYWESSSFPVNNYRGVLINGIYVHRKKIYIY